VIYSSAAEKRTEKTLKKAQQKERLRVQKQLKRLKSKAFESADAACAALEAIATNWKYHAVVAPAFTEKVTYANRGRPTADTPIKSRTWQIQAFVTPDTTQMKALIRKSACFVLGTNIPQSQLTDREVFAGYKGQNAVEQGFGFLKDPLFFVSSLFVKKPSRIEGLLMVMTLALLVYSIAQRRPRRTLAAKHQSIPNQIGQPQQTPTLGWMFHLLEGIHRVSVSIEGQSSVFIEGLTDLKRQILCLFGERVKQIYGLRCAGNTAESV